MVTKAYAHKNGNQSGIKPNKVFLKNVSTPVLTKNASESVMPIRPNKKASKSFFSLFVNKRTVVNRI